MRIVAAAALLVSASAHACPGLVVEDAWIRALPPGGTMTAGYAKLRNSGSRPLSVYGAVAPGFAAAELHHTVVEDGVSRMRHGEPLRVAPGAQAALEPGGWHLMLMGPTRPLPAGSRVPVTLQCGAESTEFTFTVRAPE